MPFYEVIPFCSVKGMKKWEKKIKFRHDDGLSDVRPFVHHHDPTMLQIVAVVHYMYEIKV